MDSNEPFDVTGRKLEMDIDTGIFSYVENVKVTVSAQDIEELRYVFNIFISNWKNLLFKTLLGVVDID